MDVKSQFALSETRVAVEKLGPHDRRLFVRWCFSQAWAAHVPWPCQKSTRTLAMRFFTKLMDFMAENVPTAGKPGMLVDGASFDAATKAAERCEPGHLRGFIEQIVEWFISQRVVPVQRANEIREARAALVLNLRDMEVQQQHNAAGWVPPGESKPKAEPKKRAPRARKGTAYPREG